MLNKSVNGHKWVSIALDKLKAYLGRAPIIVSDITGTVNGQDGVFIVLNDQKKKNFFPYEYELEPKVWVHNIKTWLVNYYPRLIETIKAPVELTYDEKALIVEETGSIDNIPNFKDRIIQKYSWRIDKILAHRDIFLLMKEGEISDNGNFVPAEEPIMRRFKYTGSTILFLKKYRSSTYKDLDDISKDFFENAIPLDDVAIRNS
jgi:hypothetical protein